VLSPAAYNAKSGLMVFCPLTTRIKGHPFEVLVRIGDEDCVVLSDQVKSLDWRARRARRKGSVPEDAMREVQAKLKALLGVR
jgi:mRNA interferase MazF